MKRITLAAVSVVALLLLTVGASSASADTYTFNINTPNQALAPYTGPYASVLVTTNGTNTATVTFTSYAGFLLGSQGAADINVNPASTLVSITGTASSGFNGPSLTSGGSGNVSDFGTMNFTADEFDGWNYGLTSITFTLQKNSGNYGSANSILTANSDGFLAAAHIFVCGSNPCNASTGALVTGYAGNGSGPPVPDGGMTLMLLGGALVGLEALRRKVRA